MRLKKFFLGSLLFLVCNLLFSPSTQAQDFWVYTDSYGVKTYVVSETAVRKKYAEIPVRAHLKRVTAQGELISHKQWQFMRDEGYLWASDGGKFFAIEKGPKVAYYATVVDRPDLMAALEWIAQNIAWS